jgi:hypothetical protein
MQDSLLCLFFLISMYGNPRIRPLRINALGNGAIMDELIRGHHLARKMFNLVRSFIPKNGSFRRKVRMVETLNCSLLPVLLNRLLSSKERYFSILARKRILREISGRLIRKTFVSSSGDQDTLAMVMKLLESPIPPLICRIRDESCFSKPSIGTIVDSLHALIKNESQYEDRYCPPLDDFTVTRFRFFPDHILLSKHILYRLLSLIEELNPSFLRSMRTSFFSQDSLPQIMCVGNAESELKPWFKWDPSTSTSTSAEDPSSAGMYD